MGLITYSPNLDNVISKIVKILIVVIFPANCKIVTYVSSKKTILDLYVVFLNQTHILW